MALSLAKILFELEAVDVLETQLMPLPNWFSVLATFFCLRSIVVVKSNLFSRSDDTLGVINDATFFFRNRLHFNRQLI